MLIENNKIHNMDCLYGMKFILDKSIDMILCDLPYGILHLKWDKKLPVEQLWNEYNRIIKDNGAIVLTANMKFAVELISANKKWFRYDLIWEKPLPVLNFNCYKWLKYRLFLNLMRGWLDRLY